MRSDPSEGGATQRAPAPLVGYRLDRYAPPVPLHANPKDTIMQTLSLIWGILALFAMAIAFLPCLGSLNWLVLPWAGLGTLISLIALTTAKEGQSKTGSTVGLILCVLAGMFGAFRLVVGGGVL